MAIIKRGILGGMSGRVANVVGTSWKGRAVLKSLPLSVANPRTAAQVLQRDKLKSIVAAWKLLPSSFVRNYQNPESGNVSGYNAFVSKNMPIWETIDSIANPECRYSFGSYAQPQFSSTPFAKGNADYKLNVHLEGLVNIADFSATDKGCIIVADESDNSLYVSEEFTNVTILQYMEFPTGVDLDNCQLFLCVRKANGTKVSVPYSGRVA